MRDKAIWLAGLIDAVGNIEILPHYEDPWIRLKIEVTCKDAAYLLISDLKIGTVEQGNYVVEGQEAATVLRTALTHLRVKQRLAMLALHYINGCERAVIYIDEATCARQG